MDISKIEVTRYAALIGEVDDLNSLLSELCSSLKNHHIDSSANTLDDVLSLAKQIYIADDVGIGAIFNAIK